MNKNYSLHMNPQEFRCRYMLESLRLGIVPNIRIEEFTFGRDAEIATINTWLASEDVGTLLVQGAYGSGKSHLLEYIFATAANRGYAVMRASLDPNDAPPSKPKAVFRKLLHSLRYLDGTSVRGYKDFLRTFAKQAQLGDLGDSGWMRSALRMINTDHEENFWAWIQGYGFYSYGAPTLYEHGTAANIYCNILSSLGFIAATALQLKGLVIVLDEGENIDSRYYYRYQVEKGFNLIRGLASVANNDNNLIDEDIARDYSRAGIGTWFGEETGLIYHGFDQMRYSHCLPAFLKVVLAVAADLADDEALRLSDLPKHHILLDELSDEALREVFRYICLLYGTAYNCRAAETNMKQCFDLVRGKAGRGNRYFVKGSVELLDIRRFHPTLPLTQIE